MRKDQKALMAMLEKEAPGARIEVTGKGHYRITHPNFRGPLYTGGTPSCHRAMKNFTSIVRREYRLGQAATG